MALKFIKKKQEIRYLLLHFMILGKFFFDSFDKFSEDFMDERNQPEQELDTFD